MAREGQTRRVSKRNRKSNQRRGEGIKGGRGGIVQGPTRVGREGEGLAKAHGMEEGGGGEETEITHAASGITAL